MFPIPKRILVVDNDPDVLNAIRFGLTRKGYTVASVSPSDLENTLEDQNQSDAKIAPGKLEDRIIKRIEYELNTTIFHVVIVDIQLINDANPKDLSGYRLSRYIHQHFPHLPLIILTAYPIAEPTRRCLDEFGAKEYRDKTEPSGPDRMYEAVDRLFERYVKVNFDLQFTGSIMPENIACQLQEKFKYVTVEDVEEVLRRLFVGCESVQLEPLGKVALQPTESGSVVLRGQARSMLGRRQAWQVIKLTKAREIQQEALHLDPNNPDSIASCMGGQRVTQLRQQAYARQLGGLTCSLVGLAEWDTVSTFEKFFSNSQTETEEIISALERFWQVTFGNIHEDAQFQPLNLTELYVEGLHLDAKEIKSIADDFIPGAFSDEMLPLPGLEYPVFNPFVWGMPNSHFHCVERQTMACSCHGDLHSNNILIDADRHFWLIDFARARDGNHILRDFVELEADIKFRLLPALDLPQYAEFERAFIGVGDAAQSDLLRSENALYKRGYHVISALRRIALSQSRLDPAAFQLDYAYALFFQTLKMLVLNSLSPESKYRAILSAALLAEYIHSTTAPNLSAPGQLSD